MPAASQITVERIDAELPQTQCGKCGHDGCRPYAEAIVEGEAINRCPPGGEATRDRLAAMTGRPALALIEPAQTPLLAVIREAECIGCTKCIQACPVDAILGAAKQMHTVIESECTGCELCVAPCPVDCIDLIEHPSWAEAHNDAERQHYLDGRAHNGRQRFEARNRRLALKAEAKRLRREKRTAATRPETRPATTAMRPADDSVTEIDVTALKAQRATLTARLKRVERQLAKADDAQRPALQERLTGFENQLEAVDHKLRSAGTPAENVTRDHQHIAVAAAEQAMRKARQELAHFQRQNDRQGALQAQERIREAERLLAVASRVPSNHHGNDHGTPS